MTGTPLGVQSPSIAHRLLETCATCLPGEPWPSGKMAMRLAVGRPVAMRLVEGDLTHERAEHQLLRVKRESQLAAIAQRAVTREEAMCWDPLVCVDDLGHFVGIIRMPRLVSAVAELARENTARQS